MIEEGKPAPDFESASWIRSEERGQDTDFEGRQEWTDLGFRVQILTPGQRGLDHGERGQEDVLERRQESNERRHH